jgi:putative hydrolase of HD superfamily
MYRMALMAIVLDRPNLDMNRCIQMALVHDLAEAIVGDITPECGISTDEKTRLETVKLETDLSLSLTVVGGNGEDRSHHGR